MILARLKWNTPLYKVDKFVTKFKKKFKNKEMKKSDFIEGEFEDIEDDNDRKI